MDDRKRKQMCKAVYLHLLAGMSLESVAAELKLPVEEVKGLILTYRDQVLSHPQHKKTLARVGKEGKGTKRPG